MNLSIIIVNYNVKEFLQNLMHSIYKAASNLQYEIIVIDNASDDGSVDFLKEKFPDIKLIVNQKNLGFSKANNVGLSVAKGEYILFLNPDVIVGEDTFEKMIEFFKKTPSAGLAGCKILNPDGSLQLACRRSFPGPWTSFCKVSGLSALFPNSRIFARYNLTYLDENKTYEVDAVSGSFMMIKREVYKKVGGFDEQFFMYGEDLDLCYRIQKAGYKVFYVHNTQIIHYKGESTKRSSIDETKLFYNAMHLFVKKHLSSSFIVEIILRVAIAIRKFIAFWGRRRLIVISVIIDFILFDISLLAAEKLYTAIGHWRGFAVYHLLFIYTLPALLHVLAGSLIGAYKKTTLSVLKNFAAIIISFFLLSSLTFFLKQFAYSRVVVVLTYLFLFFSLTAWRTIAKLVFKVGEARNDITNRRTLLVGTSRPIIKVADKLREKKTDLHTVIGLVGLSQKDIGENIGGNKIVGSLENIRKVIKENKVTEVIFSSGELSYNQMMSVVSECQNENVEFKLIGNDLDFLVGKTSVSILDDIPLFQISYNISNPLLKFIKSLFDYLVGAIVLFFIYPFIYLTAKLNRKHRPSGRAEEKSDFINFILNVPSIFSGKVSFVGPKNPKENTNLYLGKKGLTGLWYIESAEDSEKLDIFYAKNQNIWLDLEILGKTLNKMWGTRS
jgi:GT2 family glycosyltransferase